MPHNNVLGKKTKTKWKKAIWIVHTILLAHSRVQLNYFDSKWFSSSEYHYEKLSFSKQLTWSAPDHYMDPHANIFLKLHKCKYMRVSSPLLGYKNETLQFCTLCFILWCAALLWNLVWHVWNCCHPKSIICLNFPTLSLKFTKVGEGGNILRLEYFAWDADTTRKNED